MINHCALHIVREPSQSTVGQKCFVVVFELIFFGKKHLRFYEKFCNDKFYLIENFRQKKYVLKLQMVYVIDNSFRKNLAPLCKPSERVIALLSLFYSNCVVLLPLPDQKTGLNLVLISFNYTFATVGQSQKVFEFISSL